MQPTYIDLHIHTSENPDCLTNNYNLAELKKNITKLSETNPYLISFTDHNTINKDVYLKAISEIDNILLGVELHIKNYDGRKPYHCHAYFDIFNITAEIIDDLNIRLDRLYPKKEITPETEYIPNLEAIMKAFDPYEFILLPHGGQKHSSFDKSVEGIQFDSVIERNIYYNHFDGFTSRSNSGIENSKKYFEKLGISEFVNLITCSDNYNPVVYPATKVSEAEKFVPTWMMAQPTFSGLRLSLSESSRLFYGEKPDSWMHYISRAVLKKDNIDIDIEFTPGLNVIIGGSSSGKTLLVDSIFRKLNGSFVGSEYLQSPYDVASIEVVNHSGTVPHYISQNYIVQICDQKDKTKSIDSIEILKNVFPDDEDERKSIENVIHAFASQISSLVKSVSEIENLQKQLLHISKLSGLIVTGIIDGNPIKSLIPIADILKRMRFSFADYEKDIEYLDKIELFLSNNPLVNHNKSHIEELKKELKIAYDYSEFEKRIRSILASIEKEIDDALENENREITVKRKGFENLIEIIRKYISAHKTFYNCISQISKIQKKVNTKTIQSMGHTLYIDNSFEVTKEKFLEIINGHLKSGVKQISKFENITPECLFSDNHRQQAPKVKDYADFENRIKAVVSGMDKKTYRIITREGKNFESLSAGWKTSVILDLILGSESDTATLIIDQPEDNLATGYINKGLISAIKQCKTKKQIILVSHNATIPMLGDAQNIVYCTNIDNKIEMKSNPLEGTIRSSRVVDIVAEITDGGKSSIKKRIKKYNLKNFRSDDENPIQEK